MALQPFVPQQQPGGQQMMHRQQQQAMDPFAQLGGQQMMQRQQQMMDPFAQMDAMMSPFGGPGGMGRGGMGGMGGMFGMMDAMMGEMMMGGPMEAGGMMGGGGMQCQMMSMSSGSGGQGGYSSQTTMFSSSLGPDGKQHTENFSSSTTGDRGRNITEIQQAYRNSASGVDKMSLERQMNDQGRKMVKEYNQQTGDERSTDLFRGITEAQTAQFDTQWQQNAVPYLPRHADMHQLMAAQGGAQTAMVSNAPAMVPMETNYIPSQAKTKGGAQTAMIYNAPVETVAGGYPSYNSRAAYTAPTAPRPVPSTLSPTAQAFSPGAAMYTQGVPPSRQMRF